ncbi:hypothetical protein [Ectothiorhodospira shaposhnikovii]|uniref:hypothetical protein n=1 Tax=Ectothiorhodospira shaposhnikovii TaxID=1054 RepID=UPI001908A0F7|nr:hypothetical protein [Ectothiorhodospira shaposhnikovii]
MARLARRQKYNNSHYKDVRYMAWSNRRLSAMLRTADKRLYFINLAIIHICIARCKLMIF